MSRELYKSLAATIDKGNSICLETRLRKMEGSVTEDRIKELKPILSVCNPRGRLQYQVEALHRGEGIIVREPITPPERIIICGGGHVSLSLCNVMADCGFDVIVIDERQEFANRERFDKAKETICSDFPKALSELQITPYDYVVIVTRGHACDAICLRTVLDGTMPGYLGMIGSRSRVRAQFEMLVDEGYCREQLNKVHTPIGLNIGSATPAEIAVSIAAEIIACKRLPKPEGEEERCFNESDLEQYVVKELAENCQPVAVATLIESTGSSPRKPGSKMFVKADGSICGTIGGGSGEALAIKEAMALIGSGRYKVLEVKMNASVWASEGMACGGDMTILVEDFLL